MKNSSAVVISMALFGASVSRVFGQAPGSDIEQQLRSQYHITKVGADGTILGQAGSVLVIQPTVTWSAAEQGLTALPASSGVYWYTTYNKEGRAKRATLQHGGGVADGKYGHRYLQVGEKVYLTDLEVKPTEIAFFVQSCGTCDPSEPDPNNPPYRARLAFEFDKSYLSTAGLRQVLEKTGRVLALDTSPPRQASRQPPPSPAGPGPLLGPAVAPKLPARYVSAQTPADQLQLNSDSSFSLQAAGESYHGTFVVNGNTVELSIRETGDKTTATIQGSNLTDSSGQTWVLGEQSAGGTSGGAMLRNEDVIKMVKAGFDDAIIIAKISSSKCQFDTSTDALIQLKQSGVSSALLKAIVGAGK